MAARLVRSLAEPAPPTRASLSQLVARHEPMPAASAAAEAITDGADEHGIAAVLDAVAASV